PLRVEIQLTAWAFSCTDNMILNNSVFTSHKIINRAQDFLDSTYVGMFLDFDLGCYTDDYVGCIPNLNTFYAYNSDPIDGDQVGGCPNIPFYDDNPPVQAVTYLNKTMSSFTTAKPAGVPNTSSNFPASYFNLISGSWDNGQPLTQGGNGSNSGGQAQPISFIFPDNPNDANGWSMTTESIPDGDFKAISSVYIDEMLSGAVETIDMAYTFYRDETLNHLETVDLVYQFTPQLQQMYDSKFEMACDDLYLPNENLEEANFQIFPNPTSDILNIKIENPSQANFSIFDIYGKKVLEKIGMNQSEIQLSTSILSQGVYFLKIEMDGKELVKKFIKM
ncbi:MAG: T9SS type A sorting domain-containing protein, partial [Saprospiraceae bacterium]